MRPASRVTTNAAIATTIPTTMNPTTTSTRGPRYAGRAIRRPVRRARGSVRRHATDRRAHARVGGELRARDPAVDGHAGRRASPKHITATLIGPLIVRRRRVGDREPERLRHVAGRAERRARASRPRAPRRRRRTVADCSTPCRRASSPARRRSRRNCDRRERDLTRCERRGNSDRVLDLRRPAAVGRRRHRGHADRSAPAACVPFWTITAIRSVDRCRDRDDRDLAVGGIERGLDVPGGRPGVVVSTPPLPPSRRRRTRACPATRATAANVRPMAASAAGHAPARSNR